VATIQGSRESRDREKQTMGTRLYVGNLPFSTTEDELRKLFESKGAKVTEVHMVTDRETGRPRGFAFVNVSSDSEATSSIDALNGASLSGRTLTVNEAREREGGGGGGGRGGRGGGGGGGRGRY
jgi:RNA recognition motif-containing protein